MMIGKHRERPEITLGQIAAVLCPATLAIDSASMLPDWAIPKSFDSLALHPEQWAQQTHDFPSCHTPPSLRQAIVHQKAQHQM